MNFDSLQAYMMQNIFRACSTILLGLIPPIQTVKPKLPKLNLLYARATAKKTPSL